MSRIDELADSLMKSVEGYVGRCIAVVTGRLKGIEDQLKALPPLDQLRGAQGDKGLDGQSGKDGINGKDADADAITRTVLDKVTAAFDAIPIPKDGAKGQDGINGKDAPPVDVEKIIAEILLRLPPPRDGRDGADGKSVDPLVVKAFIAEAVAEIPAKDGKDGADGRDGRDGKDAPALDFEAVVAKVLTLVPIPKDGTNGRDGKEADEAQIVTKVAALFRQPIDGKDGRDGREGSDGADGVRGDKGDQGVNGRDGVDGLDGLGFDDLSVDHDGERTITLRFARGDRIKTFPMRLDVVLDRGVYRRDGPYQKGDGVTYGGSFWICQQDTPAEPPGTSAEWRLAVKAGKPGRDAGDVR